MFWEFIAGANTVANISTSSAICNDIKRNQERLDTQIKERKLQEYDKKMKEYAATQLVQCISNEIQKQENIVKTKIASELEALQRNILSFDYSQFSNLPFNEKQCDLFHKMIKLIVDDGKYDTFNDFAKDCLMSLSVYFDYNGSAAKFAKNCGMIQSNCRLNPEEMNFFFKIVLNFHLHPKSNKKFWKPEDAYTFLTSLEALNQRRSAPKLLEEDDFLTIPK